MAFESVSYYHRAIRPLKHAITRRQFSIYSLLICHFPRSFLKKRESFLKKRRRFSQKRWTFSQKRGSFFQPPLREDFSQQIETQNCGTSITAIDFGDLSSTEEERTELLHLSGGGDAYAKRAVENAIMRFELDAMELILRMLRED